MVARGLAGAGALTVALALAAPLAQGRTLGSTTLPAGGTPGSCFGGAVVLAQASGETPSWTAPNGGSLVSWSTWAPEGIPATLSTRLVVIRGTTVAAVDVGTIPAGLPAARAVDFTPASPILLQPGDRIALGGDSSGYCYFQGGAADQGLALFTAAPALAPGATLTAGEPSPPGVLLNLAAEVVESADLRVSATAGPANAVAGGLAQLSATVANAGLAPVEATVTTTVPAGLSVSTAVAGGGSCAVAGQAVTCTIPALAAGASVPVVVLVTPAAAGSYAATFGAGANGLTEATPGDNTAAATLTVAAPPVAPPAATPRCVVPALARTPLGVARSLLPQLRCKLGTVTKASSRQVAKGAIISTKPGRGEYRAGSAVALVVSSGKPVRKPARRAGRRGTGRRGADRRGADRSARRGARG